MNAVSPRGTTDPFLADVVAGLERDPKTISPKYFYDAEGSVLFEEITAQPEYYPTRTEFEILERHAHEIAALVGKGSLLVEFGAGASRKIRVLLDALEAPAAFVPVDISGEHLRDAAAVLDRDYPGLRILPVAGDYTRDLELPIDGELADSKRVVFFPGSTIGNFTPAEAREFLKRTRTFVGPGGELILGADLKKDPGVLHAAYNDARGITAAFNMNLLARMNRDLGADVDLDAFEHRAFYNEAQGRVEMHLVSLKEQSVHIGSRAFAFCEGETIHTENSYKFTIAELREMALQAGFEPVQVWTDPEDYFSLHYLRAAAAG